MKYTDNSEWQVSLSRSVMKQLNKLDASVADVLHLLVRDLKQRGSFPGFRWRNYSKFKSTIEDKRHCHLIRGRPTYVCCWSVLSKKDKTIEVYYIGSHEKAPY